MTSRRTAMAELVRDAQQAGWTVRRRTRSGVQLAHPDGRLVQLHRTPTDHRALANARSALGLPRP